MVGGSLASSTTKMGRHDIAESGVKHNKSNKIIFKILLFNFVVVAYVKFWTHMVQTHRPFTHFKRRPLK